jgi:hypothetical protein
MTLTRSIDAEHKSAMTQLGMNWGLSIGALVVVLPTVWTVANTTTAEDESGGADIISVGADKERELQEFERHA